MKDISESWKRRSTAAGGHAMEVHGGYPALLPDDRPNLEVPCVVIVPVCVHRVWAEGMQVARKVKKESTFDGEDGEPSFQESKYLCTSVCCAPSHESRWVRLPQKPRGMRSLVPNHGDRKKKKEPPSAVSGSLVFCLHSGVHFMSVLDWVSPRFLAHSGSIGSNRY